MLSLKRKTFLQCCGLTAASLALAACGASASAGSAAASSTAPAGSAAGVGSAAQGAAEPAAGKKTVRPLPATLFIDALTDCTFPAAFEPKDVYRNDDGALVVRLTVYDYELFDAAEIGSLAVGDTLVINGSETPIESIEKTEYGVIYINGGMEENGIDLATSDNGVYYEIFEDDARAYATIGEAILPVSQEFTFIDSSELESEPKLSPPGDFLIDMEQAAKDGTEPYFTPYSTIVTVEDGKISSIEKRFTP